MELMLVDKVYELKQGVSIDEAYVKTQKDGIDQVYFESNGKNYVATGDNLNIKKLKTGFKGKLDGKDAIIMFVDNEINSAKEGAENVFKTAKNIAIGAGIGGATLSTVGCILFKSNGGLIDFGLALKAMSVVSGGLAVAGVGVAVGGAIVGVVAIKGANTTQRPEIINSLIKQ